MADVLVLKIKYEETLRRITVPRSPEPSFASLDKKIRELFNLPQQSPFVVTYTDNEGDIVTMADDDDLKDAVTFQSLNPLRLKVELLESRSSPVESPVAPGEQKPADAIPEQVDSTQTPKATKDSAGSSKVPGNMGKIQEVLEEKLKAAFGVDVEALSAAFQPLLSVAPRALDEVMDAALKSGFTASFEPNFCMSEEKSEKKSKGEVSASTSSSEKSAVPDEASGEQVKPCFPKAGDDAAATAADTASERVFHSGVQCDMCGMTPIVGPRYKSNVKADYDLCRSCYEQHGVAGEYNKIDRGLFRPRQFPFWAHAGRPGFNGHPFGPGPRVCYGGRPYHMGRGGGCGRSFENRCPEGKLESRFVKDVTIFDGTEFAPGTPFTKIWRLRNTGSIPWPQHTRLVHVGGDNFGADDVVTVPVPEEGLQPGEEVEVSVDLLAPEKAGRYVSHWRLTAPGGRKFGHRVWVLIQVVPSDEPSPQVAESVADVASNSEAGPSTPPLDSEKSVIQSDSTPTLSEGMGVEKSVIEDENSSDHELASAVEVVPSVDDIACQKDVTSEVKENIVHIPEVVDTPAVPEPELQSEEKTSVGGFSFIDHPPIETVAVHVGEPSNVVPVQIPVQEEAPEEAQGPDVEVNVSGNISGEEEDEFVNVESGNAQSDELLQQLEAMGFSDRELNKELLEQYNMDFARVLDELVAAAEWDPMLEELEEMGFYDTKVNRRLMLKNKGSVKRVVQELVQMYKAGKA